MHAVTEINAADRWHRLHRFMFLTREWYPEMLTTLTQALVFAYLGFPLYLKGENLLKSVQGTAHRLSLILTTNP